MHEGDTIYQAEVDVCDPTDGARGVWIITPFGQKGSFKGCVEDAQEHLNMIGRSDVFMDTFRIVEARVTKVTNFVVSS